MSDGSEALDVARRFFDAIENGDVATLDAIYAPDVAIWHNTDRVEGTKDENLRTLRRMVKYISDRRYEHRSTHAFPGGFVQQHVLKGTRRDGVTVELPACIICLVDKGKITRLDEYFDSRAEERFAG